MKGLPNSSSPSGKGREYAPKELFGLVFDCDGVLFDSKDANTAYYNHIRSAVQLPPMTAEEEWYSHMASTEQALERIIPGSLREEAALVRQRTKYRDTFMAMMRPATHMLAFLHNMHAAGLRMALCTNRSDSVFEVLRHFKIEAYFSPVMTISRVHPKPHPDGLLEIAQTWKVSPDHIAFIGDSLVDQQAATAAGVPFWSYANQDLSAVLHVTGFEELDEIMKLTLMP